MINNRLVEDKLYELRRNINDEKTYHEAVAVVQAFYDIDVLSDDEFEIEKNAMDRKHKEINEGIAK